MQQNQERRRKAEAISESLDPWGAAGLLEACCQTYTFPLKPLDDKNGTNSDLLRRSASMMMIVAAATV